MLKKKPWLNFRQEFTYAYKILASQYKIFMLFIFGVHSVRPGTCDRYILKRTLCNNDITNDSTFPVPVYESYSYWTESVVKLLQIESRWNEKWRYQN